MHVLVLDGDTRQCLPMIRALRALGHRVTVACESRLSMGALSWRPHRRILLPSAEYQPEAFLAELLGELQRVEYDLLVPLFDICADLVSRNKAALEAHVPVAIVDFPIFEQARDKARTMRICQDHGLPAPRTWFPEEEAAEEIAAKAAFPLLVKPRVAHGAAGISRVDGPAELAARLSEATERFGPCIVQELIPQTDLQYKAEFFRDDRGRLHAGVVFSKLRYFPISGGTSAINQTVQRPDILETGRRLLDAMEWVGYADLDLIQDPRDGLAKVMEVNPRVTGSVKIAFEAGVDFADLMTRFYSGRELRSYLEYRAGVTMRYIPLDILWFLYSGDRFRAQPSWFRFLGRDLCYQVLSFSDPGPFLSLGLGGIRKLLSPQVRADKLGSKAG
jgi:predicted ATP-grasp superfamily ATP-dependent carboligase